MAVLQWWDRVNLLPDLAKSAPGAVRESARRKQLVSTILLVVAGFQFVNLPGAIVDADPLALGTIMLGLVICGVAMLFNRGGKAIVSSILLIVVVDLGVWIDAPWGLMWQTCWCSMC